MYFSAYFNHVANVVQCSAELTKYDANCMLDTKISFMREMANLVEILGADIEMVRQGIGFDPCIGDHFIYLDAGYGGSCFKLLKAVENCNNEQKINLFKRINKHFNGDLAGKTFALLGLSFKPNIDDMLARQPRADSSHWPGPREY